jgi:Nucleotidyl transferase AbiEii toxin, Type IV TA system
LRLRTRALIDGARVPVVIDIGFGDAIEPGLDEIDYPVLLDAPAPKLRGYRHETVIAEKSAAPIAA